MSWLASLLRRARIRGLVDGTVQRARAEALEGDAKDDAERWQDYGFAANPVDGQGLVINVAGHTLVVRMDRIAERPHLAAYEVALWHKEGHMVRLKAGRVVEVTCDSLAITAADGVTIDAPTVQVTGTLRAPKVQAADSLTIAGKEMHLHTHGGVSAGSATSGPPA